MFKIIQTQKDSYINSEIQGWRGNGKISVGYHRQVEKYEKIMTTTYIRDIDGNFVVKLHCLNIGNNFFITKLPLNEDDNNFDIQLNDKNYKRTIRKLHDAG